MIATDKDSIGRALGRVPSGLYIVTVRLGERATAFLGSWVQQASFEPPVISVAVKAGRPVQGLLEDGGSFAVNVVPSGDTVLMKHFARGFEPGQDPYAGVTAAKGISGVEILPDALAVLECRVVGSYAAGDHSVYFGEVIAGQLQAVGGEPHVHLRKSGFTY